MADHRFPLQMECLTIAAESFPDLTHAQMPDGTPLTDEEHTKMVLRRASAFLGWVQATTPSHREANSALRPPRRIVEALGDPIEGPAR